MTQNAKTTVLQHARELTRNAAQSLELLSFRSRPGVTPFGTNVCHYHAMLDPAASDVDRLTACRAMQLAVQPLHQRQFPFRRKAPQPTGHDPVAASVPSARRWRRGLRRA